MNGKSIATQLFALISMSIIAGLVIAETARTAEQDASGSMEAKAPKVIAVKFHADWCGFCKQMGAAFEEMQAKFDQEPVLYVTFDQTRDFGRTQSEYLAHAMGLNDMWKENGGKTGFVLLIDAGSRNVIQKLTHEQNLKQIGAALQEAVQGATVRPASTREHPKGDHPKSDHPKSDHPK